jgi:hypothetical protein
MATGLRVDVRERAGGYQEVCAVCGRPRASVRALLWWPPDRDPPGVPAWRVEVRHYCAEHRVEADLLEMDRA